MRKLLYHAVLIGVVCGPAAADVPVAGPDAVPSRPATSRAGTLFARVEYFRWEETREDGSRLLTETGPLYGLGLSGHAPLVQRLSGAARAEVFFGEADYEGQVVGGDTVDTTTRYYGADVRLAASLSLFPDTAMACEPRLGVSGKWWVRDIEDVSAELVGYEEEWTVLFGYMGVRLATAPGRSGPLFLEAGIRYPFYSRVVYDFSSIGFGSNVTVEPGAEMAFLAETGWEGHGLIVVLYYEQLRFSESNHAQTDGLEVWQPKSEADMVGVRFEAPF